MVPRYGRDNARDPLGSIQNPGQCSAPTGICKVPPYPDPRPAERTPRLHCLAVLCLTAGTSIAAGLSRSVYARDPPVLAFDSQRLNIGRRIIEGRSRRGAYFQLISSSPTPNRLRCSAIEPL